MDLGLGGKAAIIGGGSSGLGYGVAEALVAEGCDVSIGARDPKRLASAAERLQHVGGGQVHHAVVDVCDESARRAWVREAAEVFGGLHIVVSNAGGPPAGSATDFELAAYREAVELSLLAQIGIVQEALPHLQRAGWGRIIFVTSQSVRQPIPGLALSNTARAGVLGYAKSLVAALGAGDITVNVLAPGSHRTPRLEDLARQRGEDVEDVLAGMAQAVPLGRIGDPAEFGAAAAFLASERAGYITGAVLPVDGGSTNLLL